MGLALLQTASNPYISVIGPIESAAKRISIMGICNKVAGALSPLVLGAIVLQDATGIEGQINATTDLAIKTGLLQSLSERVIIPYAIMATVLIALAVMIWLSPLPEIETDGSTTTDNQTQHKSIFHIPYLMFGILCLFLYVGVEVMAGDVIGTYGKAIGIGLDETKVFTSYTLWSMVIGYIIGILTIPKYIKQQNALALSAIAGIVLSLGVFFTTGYTSIVFIALLGFANALMWPAIFPLAIENLGKFTKLGSALLVMGIAGGAVLPQLYARIVPTLGPPSAFFWIVAPCYAYILFYATKGHMLGKR
jgi:glucose/galactose transporter